MEKKSNLQITELFMAKCGKTDWGRCFHGIIKREKDKDGNPILFSKITMHDGYHFNTTEGEWICDKKPNITGFIYAADDDQWKLGEKLDDLVVLVLTHGIHKHAGVFLRFGDFKYYLS